MKDARAQRLAVLSFKRQSSATASGLETFQPLPVYFTVS